MHFFFQFQMQLERDTAFRTTVTLNDYYTWCGNAISKRQTTSPYLLDVPHSCCHEKPNPQWNILASLALCKKLPTALVNLVLDYPSHWSFLDNYMGYSTKNKVKTNQSGKSWYFGVIWISAHMPWISWTSNVHLTKQQSEEWKNQHQANIMWPVTLHSDQSP